MSLPEAKVSYIYFDRIHPATHTESNQRLELTPWDLPMLELNLLQKGILFNSKPLHATWLTDLKTSMCTALEQFYVLAGRLAIESNQDNTVSIFVHCNNQGADFIFATADITTSEILSPLYVPRIVRDFFSPIDLINYDESGSQPLLSVQVTELIDGVFLGFTMNHMVVDGSSFWHFINSWSEICRTGSCQSQKPPTFQRWFLNTTDLPIRIPSSKIQRLITPRYSPPLPEIILHFTSDNILKLKHKANLEINNNTVKISSLQAVLAHLWIGVTRARNIDADQTVSYWLAMGNRGRLDPSLPDEYFGNCFSACNGTAKVGDLLNRGIGFAASLLNQVVSSHTNTQICTAWENFVKEPSFPFLGSLPSMPNNILTGSSPRFNMYGNDFGWGCPIAVRSGGTIYQDGMMWVYPGAVVGSMDIEVCLSPETIRRLGEDNYFLEFVGPKHI